MIGNFFSQQFKIMLETVHIPEKIYDALGFTTYEISVVVYDCNDGLQREWIQRAKVLTHWFCQHLRLERQKKIEDKTEKKGQDKQKAINDFIQLNEEAEINLPLEINKYNETKFAE